MTDIKTFYEWLERETQAKGIPKGARLGPTNLRLMDLNDVEMVYDEQTNTVTFEKKEQTHE